MDQNRTRRAVTQRGQRSTSGQSSNLTANRNVRVIGAVIWISAGVAMVLGGVSSDDTWTQAYLIGLGALSIVGGIYAAFCGNPYRPIESALEESVEKVSPGLVRPQKLEQVVTPDGQCAGCRSHVESNMSYCPSCGARLRR